MCFVMKKYAKLFSNRKEYGVEITKKKKFSIFISWALVFLWMGVIFSLSAQVATDSNGLSRGVTEVVLDAVEKVAPSTSVSVESLNHFIRKEAHFFAYLILGLLVSHAFSRHGLHGAENARHTLVICLLYAVSDEAHQILVPGRGPSLVDVFIDGMGAVIGLLANYVMHLPFKRKVHYEGINN